MPVSTAPTYPTTGQKVTLSLTDAVGNVVYGELTSVPHTSKLTTGTLKDATGARIAYFTPDAPGAYGVYTYDYRKFPGTGGGYQGAPAGEAREDLITRQTGTVYVGDKMDLPVITQLGHGCTIRITVVDATVRAAEFVNPTTDIGRIAALDATSVTSLATCVGVAVTAIEDPLETTVTNLRAKYELHRLHSTHVASDTVNTIVLEAPYANRSARDVLNEVFDKLLAHMTSGGYHGTNDDLKNLPLCGKARDDATATVLSAELRYRVYDLHRVQTASPTSHAGSGDTTNTLAAAKPLAATIRDYLRAIYLLTPTTPTGEQDGAIAAAHRFGFKRTTT